MSAKEKPGKSKPPPRLARWYPPPDRKPIPWWDHPNEQVRQAVAAYLYGVGVLPSSWRHCNAKEGRWVIAYCQYAIEAPCWQCDPESLSELRRRAMLLGSARQVGDWLQSCLDCRVDILGGLP